MMRRQTVSKRQGRKEESGQRGRERYTGCVCGDGSPPITRFRMHTWAAYFLLSNTCPVSQIHFAKPLGLGVRTIFGAVRYELARY